MDMISIYLLKVFSVLFNYFTKNFLNLFRLIVLIIVIKIKMSHQSEVFYLWQQRSVQLYFFLIKHSNNQTVPGSRSDHVLARSFLVFRSVPSLIKIVDHI